MPSAYSIPLFAVLLLLLFIRATLAVPASNKSSRSPCTSHDLDFDCGPNEPAGHRCISGYSQCDNVFDCKSGLDEQNCNYLHKCPTGEFMCLNGYCVPAESKCNGFEDCPDGSDERGCFSAPVPLPQPFLPTNSAIRRKVTIDDLFHRPSDFNALTAGVEDPFADKVEMQPCVCETRSSAVSTFFLVVVLLGIALPIVYLLMQRFRTRSISRVDSALKELNTRIATTGASSLSPSAQHSFLDSPTNTLQQPTPITFKM